jgi:hypothetical protein
VLIFKLECKITKTVETQKELLQFLLILASTNTLPILFEHHSDTSLKYFTRLRGGHLRKCEPLRRAFGMHSIALFTTSRFWKRELSFDNEPLFLLFL